MQQPPPMTPAPLRRESMTIDPLAAIPPSIPYAQPDSNQSGSSAVYSNPGYNNIQLPYPPNGPSRGADSTISQVPANHAQAQAVAPLITVNYDMPYNNNNIPPPMSNVQKVSVIQTPLLLPQQTISPLATLEKLSTSFLAKCSVPPLNLTKVPKNLNGLDILVQCNAWKYCIDLVEPMITNSGDISSTSDILLKYKLQGLYRMKQFDNLLVEISKIIAHEESLTNKANMDAVISMKLLLADIKILTAQGEDAIQQMYLILHWLQDMKEFPEKYSNSKSIDVDWWLWRAKGVILSAKIWLKLWRSAYDDMISMLNDIRSQISNSCVNGSLDDQPPITLIQAEIVMHLRISRLLLNIGSLKVSQHYYNNALVLADTYTESLHSYNEQCHLSIKCQISVTAGLIAFTNDDFSNAMHHFNEVINMEQQKQSSELKTIEGGNRPFADIADVEESLLPIAVNNYAVCALYVRKIDEAIEKLEGIICKNTPRYMTDPVVFNLCILYDISCAPELSIIKKKVLQNVATAYHLSDPVLNWRSFRM